ncbi:MAG: DUF4197 domain-containing protein [Saprospiraceae bacterium]|nr:DUF4197 domain-containing protein [Saprospiraceae bacterium]MCB9324328.1 DUF4197 domain-containing protein [Lewinellaceae bacterium]
MIKKIFALILVTQLYACAELQSALGTILESSGELTESQIASGLKEALDSGISKGAATLSQQDGYFKSSYKILLPPEARKVTDKLKNIPGFSDVEDIILEKINRGAEDAAKKAKPIFVDAIKNMTFSDVMNVLMGADDSATRYLEGATSNKLYREFNPVIVESLDKFNARKYWSDAVTAYNKIPFIEKVDADLDDYVTKQALNGLFSMVEKEEKNIRNNIAARTTDLLKRVFAKQDK